MGAPHEHVAPRGNTDFEPPETVGERFPASASASRRVIPRWAFALGGVAAAVIVLWLAADRLASDASTRPTANPSAGGRPAGALNRYFADVDFYRADATPLKPLVLAQPIRSWLFTPALLHQWQTFGDVRTKQDRGAMLVGTSLDRFAYQMVSPTVALAPGTYGVILDGAVLDGGLGLGVIGGKSAEWISRRDGVSGSPPPGPNLYWSGQFPSGNSMASTFTLRRPERVQIVLANWARTESSSSWRLRGLTLGRVAPGQ